jgi:hypothetical protein
VELLLTIFSGFKEAIVNALVSVLGVVQNASFS